MEEVTEPTPDLTERLDQADTFITASNADIRNGGDRAYVNFPYALGGQRDGGLSNGTLRRPGRRDGLVLLVGSGH